jgi:SRSO17 transposase
VLRRVRVRVLSTITRDEAVQALIIDDTGFPKKRSQSACVAWQRCD